jgi:hypothetical protein
MKLKSLFFFCIFIALSATSICQTFTSDFSEGKSATYNNFRTGIITKAGRLVLKDNIQSSGGLINIKVDKKASILLMNEKNEVIKETPLMFKNYRFIRIKGLFQLNGKPILVYTYKNEKKEEQYTVDVIKLGETGKPEGKDIELCTIQTSPKDFLPDFNFITTGDSTKYLLFAEPIQNKKDLKQFYYGFFNSDLNKLNEAHVELPIENRFVQIGDNEPDNFGNLFVQYTVYEKEINQNTGDYDQAKMIGTTKIIQYSPDGKNNEIALNLDGKFLYLSSFLFGKTSQNIKILGMYKNENKGMVSGVFYCDYDPVSKLASNTKLSSIPEEILDLFDKEHIASNGKKDAGISRNFRGQKVSYRNNGTIDYTLEYNKALEKVSTYTNLSGFSMQTPFTYIVCNSILNINIDAKGKMIFTRIPKAQKIGNWFQYTSYFSFDSGNKLIFLYNDDKDNVDRDLNKAPDDIDPSSRNSVLMAAIIDEKGNLNRKIIYEHKDDKYVTLISGLRLATPNTILCEKTKITSFFDLENAKLGTITIKP